MLQRVHGPFTSALLDSAGIKQGARCLDAGCGGGHVSRDLAARVGKTGSVVGSDLDEVVLELARSDVAGAGITNVEFRTGDATDLDVSGFDVLVARFFFSRWGRSGCCQGARPCAEARRDARRRGHGRFGADVLSAVSRIRQVR